MLHRVRCTLLVTTYRTGRLIAVGTHGERLRVDEHQFDHAMGVAATDGMIAVGGREHLWLLGDESRDHRYRPRSAVVTEAIRCRELAWGTDDGVSPSLWVVDAASSCLAGLRADHSLAPRWRPPVRSHLTGLGMRNGRPAFVTVTAPHGCVLDVGSGAVVTAGLATPHSPRWHGGALLVLDSGRGTLDIVDLDAGGRTTVARLPGFPRGLACHRGLAFVGLSRIRGQNGFGGGIAAVDLATGETLATLELASGHEEIFDVQVLPDTTGVAFSDDEPAETLLAAARTAHRGGRPADAVTLLRRAEAAQPASAEIATALGDALRDVGHQPQAIALYRRAVASDPDYRPALQSLGSLLVEQGTTDEGVGYLRRAQQVAPSDLNRLLIATAVPVVQASAADAARRRQALERNVSNLVDDGVTIDTTRTLVPSTFYAAYDGVDDRALHADLGRVFAGPSVVTRARRPRDRPRIGFLSAYFCDHTIGQLNLGRIQRLDRERFEVVVLSAGARRDPVAAAFEEAADAYVQLPSDPASARRLVAEQDLDVLIFTDVGMDALTSTLAYSRMAPLQCATWGHPVTTGSPEIDCFISSELLEVAGAEAHYTERLVRLESLGIWYPRPQVPPEEIRLGVDDDAHVYACPQTLFKLHPTFDPLIAEILRRDPRGLLLLIEGRVPTWTRLLRERLRREMPDVADRVRWVAPLPRAQFLALLRAAHVLLDPITFGGGNTTYEALAMGSPVVTLPGDLLRTRIATALYTKAGYTELVASSAEQYVELAVALGTDADYRERVRERIGASCDALYEDDAEVRDLEDFLTRTVAA